MLSEERIKSLKLREELDEEFFACYECGFCLCCDCECKNR